MATPCGGLPHRMPSLPGESPSQPVSSQKSFGVALPASDAADHRLGRPVTGWPADKPYALRATPTVRRALGVTLPEAVAAAAYEFITGPLLLEPYRVGKRLLPPLDDRLSARRGTYRIIYRVDDKAGVITLVDAAIRCLGRYF
jgi:mRNA interferase RelE/StbE